MEEVLEQVQGGLESKAKLRDLTVMYMDIVGFTAYSERHAPEEIANIAQ